MKQQWSLRVLVALVCLIGVCSWGCASGGKGSGDTVKPQANEPADGRIKITRQDELPQHSYPYTGSVLELVDSPEMIAELAAKVRENIEADLAKYNIQDNSALQSLYGTLMVIDLINRDYDAAQRRIEQMRALEDKEALRLTMGLSTESYIEAYRATDGQMESDDFHAAFQAALERRVSDLPWDVVQDEIQSSKGIAEIVSANVIRGAIESRVQPAVDETGELNAQMASSVLARHLALRDHMAVRPDVIAVYQAYLDAHHEEKPDIWADREVTLTDEDPCEKVLVAAWDSGTDPDVFKDRLWTNPEEQFDGQDTDGNGYVDDVYGIAYDVNAEKTTGLLYPLGDVEPRIHDVMAHMKGLEDVQASIDSPDARALKQYISEMEPTQIKSFLEDLSLAGNYAHGTHVAGIMLRGNPCARLLIARLSYDHRTVPVARTLEWGERDAMKCRQTVEYFKEHGVRVVNMSWGEAQDDAEQSLELNGIGATAEERRELARAVFALQKAGLREAIQDAPNVLFICAAGNADNDVEFDEYIPSSFDLPNLLVVGAVDQAGDPTSFTSFGRTVEVFASGFEVESYIPGGEMMKMSGTSMASPNVANLAAKILAIDPDLTPREVIAWIRLGADHRTEGGHSYLLINPARTIELLEKFKRNG